MTADSSVTRLGLHAAAVLYTGGSIAQLLKLIFDFPWQEMPWAVDWAIVALGSLATVTLVANTGRIAWRGAWEKPVHYLIILHLMASVATHLWALWVRNHDMFGKFPYEYSYFALAYFGFFAWRSWTIRTR